ncbi:T9SS type A sorting domain-containing protein [Saprospira grandis]|uniref:T9SS type A sorting domain-containing protein n=1 Tax=Saprospira grandis TaxID=1008 RepID=UPI0022DD6203|nr:T9SS type A sorting domain-containing protein [Saprospira grandis]WBM74464.1 T9SS type A sorting domain-containing protein [Saprospira grandis]
MTENSHFYNSGSFGSSLAFSANGESIVISASVQYELIDNVGMLYNYRWENNSWQLKGVPIEGQHYNGRYGRDMGLSADGEYWAILGGFHSPASASKYLDYLHWDGQNWQHQSTLTNHYSLVGEMSIAFSGAGEHFVMAQAQGTTPNPYGPPPAPSPGRFRAYEFDGSQFNLKGQEIRSTDSQAFFGESVTISADGTVIVVAAPSGNNTGYIRSYAWCNNQWKTPFAQIEGNNRSNGKFGKALALSADGRRVVFNDYACHCLKTYDMQSSNNCFAITSTSPASHSSSNIRQGIYPNPNQGSFNIVLNKAAPATIRIYNTAGQLLYEKASPQSSLHEVDFRAAAGIYFVEVEQNGEKERFKFIHHGK